MSEVTAAECGQAARACIELAKVVYDLRHRAMILQLAEEWLQKAGMPRDPWRLPTFSTLPQ
jgi:hypothetical protein